MRVDLPETDLSLSLPDQFVPIDNNSKEGIKNGLAVSHLFVDAYHFWVLSSTKISPALTVFRASSCALHILANRFLEPYIRGTLKNVLHIHGNFTRKKHVESNPYYYKHIFSLSVFALQLGELVLVTGAFIENQRKPNTLNWISLVLLVSSRPALHILNRGVIPSFKSILGAF
jgi:hypothetical protein